MNDSFYNSQKSVPAGKMEQVAYTEKAKGKKTLQVLCMPDSILPGSTDAALVGKGNLLRIKGTAGGFITFGGSAVAVADSTNGLETELGYFLIVAPDDYIRTSAAMRIEIVKD